MSTHDYLGILDNGDEVHLMDADAIVLQLNLPMNDDTLDMASIIMGWTFLGAHPHYSSVAIARANETSPFVRLAIPEQVDGVGGDDPRDD